MKYIVSLNGKEYEVLVSHERTEILSTNNIEKTKVDDNIKVDVKTKVEKSTSTGVSIESPLSGVIVKIEVSRNQNVKRGQVMLVLEAMKMENEIVSPVNGVVTDITCSVGSNVNIGEILIIID